MFADNFSGTPYISSQGIFVKFSRVEFDSLNYRNRTDRECQFHAMSH